MNITGKPLAFFYVFGLVLPALSAQEGLSVSWKIALLKKAGSVYESVPFAQPLAMTRKDTYHISLATLGEGHCYALQENDEGRLSLVYRKSFLPWEEITLPADGTDFKAAELPGTSRLYIIVSASPRANLERLMDQYFQGAAAPSLERSLLSEVLAIRRNFALLPAVPPGAGVPAVWLFEGRDCYAVTITVRNQG
jgi:hypothetical protein